MSTALHTLQTQRRQEAYELQAAYQQAAREPMTTREETQATLRAMTKGMRPTEKAHTLYRAGVRPQWIDPDHLSILSLTDACDRTVTVTKQGFVCDCPATVTCYHCLICEISERAENRPFEVA